jgi:hypothetical protein
VFAQLPLSFEANQGQTDPQVKFLARTRDAVVFLTPTELVLSVVQPAGKQGTGDSKPAPPLGTGNRARVQMRLVGANPASTIEGREPSSTTVNYYVGADPQRWRSGVPTYRRVAYRDVYPGIDVIYYGREGRLEYDFVVLPGADPKQIRLAFTGPQRLEIDSRGDLLLHTTAGPLRYHQPIVYQDVDGQRRAIDGHYVLKDHQQVGLKLARYDRQRPLVIDPYLTFANRVGTSGDGANAIALDRSRSIYMAGQAVSADFAPGQQSAGGVDAFVTKFDAGGLVPTYSTYLGGSGDDVATGIAVIPDETAAYVTGFTTSINFPTKNPLQAANAGGLDAFVTKLDSTGSALIFSTYLGGSADDHGNGIAVDGTGAYVAGDTASSNFPVKGGVQSKAAGGSDAFVAKLDPLGASLAYSTYLGDSGDDAASGIAVDASGAVYVVGRTRSLHFPTSNAAQLNNQGFMDGFVTKLDPLGSALVYSTYLGGSRDDAANAVAVDSTGAALVTGQTVSGNFPRTSAYQTQLGGGTDAFVTKLSAGGNLMLYSTYFGGTFDDVGNGVAVDLGGFAYVTGSTRSIDFPQSRAIQQFNGGNFDAIQDAFLAQFDMTKGANSLLYSTFLGTASDNGCWGLDLSRVGGDLACGRRVLVE